jgi:hypothetical protein
MAQRSGQRHMATGEQAIAALATHTGIDHAHVRRTARILREASGDLWPQSERGGGRRARHVQPHHLGNLAIALAVAEPITKGPNRVQAFRMLGRESGDFPGTTFGAALDGLIDRVSRRTGRWLSGVAIVLFPGMMPKAMITHPLDGQATYVVSDMDLVQVAGLMRISVLGIDHIIQISASVIQTLADLCADSRAAQPARERESGTSLPGDVPLSARPTDEGLNPHAEDRSLDSGDLTARVCVSATPESAGGQLSTVEVHHDDADPGDDAGRLDSDHRSLFQVA